MKNKSKSKPKFKPEPVKVFEVDQEQYQTVVIDDVAFKKDFEKIINNRYCSGWRYKECIRLDGGERFVLFEKI